MLATYLEHIYTVTEIKDLVLVNLHSCLSAFFFFFQVSIYTTGCNFPGGMNTATWVGVIMNYLDQRHAKVERMFCLKFSTNCL